MSADRLIGGPLTVDEAAAAGEPRSLIRRFWEGLARGQTEVVEEVTREISPPTISAFSFGEDDDWAGGRSPSSPPPPPPSGPEQAPPKIFV